MIICTKKYILEFHVPSTYIPTTYPKVGQILNYETNETVTISKKLGVLYKYYVV